VTCGQNQHSEIIIPAANVVNSTKVVHLFGQYGSELHKVTPSKRVAATSRPPTRLSGAIDIPYPSHGGAFAAGVVSGTWKPRDRHLVAEGYRAAFVQVGFGFAANWQGEFAPDINRILWRKKAASSKSD